MNALIRASIDAHVLSDLVGGADRSGALGLFELIAFMRISQRQRLIAVIHGPRAVRDTDALVIETQGIGAEIRGRVILDGTVDFLLLDPEPAIQQPGPD